MSPIFILSSTDPHLFNLRLKFVFRLREVHDVSEWIALRKVRERVGRSDQSPIFKSECYTTVSVQVFQSDILKQPLNNV